jgi:Zn-dependent peptidase ImmA (M78 family)/DNA-binding XRE family transcriptional regulator
MEDRFPSADANGFVPARLTVARNARGMKQVELAETMGCAPATISKWESDGYDHSPDGGAISELSKLLSVEASWFYKPMTRCGNVAFFRSLKSALNIARDKTSAKLRFVDDISQALSERVEFPSIDIPDLVGSRDYKTLRSEDIDSIAYRLREYWGLGEDPIEDLMVVIENAGVVVAEDFVESAKLDGVSKWFSDRPVMLLAKDKQGGVRRRFDAAHELGHLILHQAVRESDIRENIDLIEEQAMIFAGSFLLPASSFFSDINDLTLDAFADLKPQWKVSIGAMIKRAGVLNLITPESERNLWKYYSYRKWRGAEPYDDRIEVEQPVNLKAATEMVAEEGPRETAALMEDIGISAKDVADLTGVNLSILTAPIRQKAKLKLVSREASEPMSAAND